MTDIRLAWQSHDGTGPFKDATGLVTISPVKRTVDGETIIIDKPFTVRIDGETVISLPPTTAENAYRFRWNPVNGDDWTDYVAIPVAGLVAYTMLPKVDPETLGPVQAPEAAWWAALDSAQMSEGVQGPIGPKGEDGHSPILTWEGTALSVDGIPGPNLLGPKGDRGPEGPVGPEGPRGLQGVEGPIGPEGPEGVGIQGPKGDKGDTGPAGPQGEEGVAGAQGPAGPAGLEWRGNWSADVDYVNDDAVFHGGSSWFAAGDPDLGEVPSIDSSHWNPLALQGIQGERGPKGDAGAEGPQGVAGAEGPEGPQGVQGPKGDKGDVGPEGPQGTQGAGVMGGRIFVQEAEPTDAVSGDIWVW